MCQVARRESRVESRMAETDCESAVKQAICALSKKPRPRILPTEAPKLRAMNHERKGSRKKAFKLRLDLLKHVTPEDIMEEAMANVSRYKPEPSLAKTGVGHLRPATPEERQAEMARSEAFIKRLRARAVATKQRQRKKKA